MEQAAWDARSASLHPISTAELLRPVPEPMLGRREGTDSLVSAAASLGGKNPGGGGGVREPPVAILAGKTGMWGSGTVSPGWPCVV